MANLGNFLRFSKTPKKRCQKCKLPFYNLHNCAEPDTEYLWRDNIGDPELIIKTPKTKRRNTKLIKQAFKIQHCFNCNKSSFVLVKIKI